MRKTYRKRHTLRGFIAGKAEHHALIPCADIIWIGIAMLGFKALVNAHCDIRGLPIYRTDNCQCMTVKAVFRLIIADIQHNITHKLGNINVAISSNFSHYHDHTGGCTAFAGHA